MPIDHPRPAPHAERSVSGAARRLRRTVAGAVGVVGAGRCRCLCTGPLAQAGLRRTPVAGGAVALRSGRWATPERFAHTGSGTANSSRGQWRCAHARTRAPGLAGHHDRDPTPPAGGRCRVAPAPQRRAPSAQSRCAAGALSARLAGANTGHCPALHLRPRPAALSIPSRTGAARALGHLVAASFDRGRHRVALAKRAEKRSVGADR
ncbi:hypothetical protein D3C78_1040480 [compost metagenome]